MSLKLRLEKACCLSLWILVLVCLLGEALYLIYTGYLDPRGVHLSHFDANVREWNTTARATFASLHIQAGERDWVDLTAQTSEAIFSEADEESTWYLPMHYQAVLNQTHLSEVEFNYNVNVSASVRVMREGKMWELQLPQVATIKTVKEQVTEVTCSRHNGYHDPIFGWCISFHRLHRFCLTLRESDEGWEADKDRPGCAGEEMNELAEYESLAVQAGSQTPELPIPVPSLLITVRSWKDPIFTAFTETGGSFEFGVRDTVYKVLGVCLLCMTLVLLIHPICYFRRKYRDWRRRQHRKFVEAGEEARRSKTPPLDDISF